MVGRRTLLSQIAVVAALTVAGCATVPPEPTDRAALRDRLMVLERGSWEHTQRKDVASMQSYLAEDAILIFGDGSRFTKAEFLRIIPDFNLPSFTIDPSYDVMMVTPDVATLLYKVTYTSAIKNDRPTTITASSSSTYARRNGAWLSVLYQETPIR